MFVEPGIRAGRVSVGYSAVGGQIPVGGSVRVSFLRNYGRRPLANYFGVEAQALIAFGLRVGLFRSLQDTDVRFVWDVSYLL